jgi:hypothetical protein
MLCEEGTWEDVLGAIRARKREIDFLGEALGAGGRYGIPICPTT